MPAPLPIRPDVVPTVDAEREMLNFFAAKLRENCDLNGRPPHSVAFVFVSHDKVGQQTEGYSWSPTDEESTKLHTCSVASAVLLKRAVGLF